ncbi:hypothetical protein [Pandoraea sp. XY-2]|uniref:hypothetical protein n=1 Tax=Pandoraea sp. XY-2 TaxID=2518599 RepID=UPI0010225170|nr:hypothetical protein [Pandoraea sp. XY-2]
MLMLSTYLAEQASRTEDLLVQIAERNENIRNLYRSRLMQIIYEIRSRKLQAPSDALAGYWYYFSPEGPWQIWETFPDLVSSISALINLLQLNNDAEFIVYCRRHKINISRSIY